MPVPFAHPASVAVHEPSACSTNFQSDDAQGPGDVCRNVRLARSQPRVVGGSVVPGAGVLAHPNSDDTTIATAPNPADVRVVMSDNGSGYISADFRDVVSALHAKHLRTRPYTPRTNGKAERLIQTMLRLWAYVRPYGSSDERASALTPWLAWYNRQRPHGSLQDRTPVETLKDLRRDNLVGDHS